MKYLLDTCICVDLLRRRQETALKLNHVGWDNCYISEITIAELLYGAECSMHPKANTYIIEKLCTSFHIVTISDSIREFVRQKAYLRKKGQIIEDSDLWIASLAVHNNMVMVTHNVKHLGRLEGVIIENWK